MPLWPWLLLILIMVWLLLNAGFIHEIRDHWGVIRFSCFIHLPTPPKRFRAGQPSLCVSSVKVLVSSIWKSELRLSLILTCFLCFRIVDSFLVEASGNR